MSRPSVTPTGIELLPDRTRVVTGFFVPGCEPVGPGESRAGLVIQRLLALDESEVVYALAQVRASYDQRHADLDARFADHAARVRSRIPDDIEVSADRALLIGACFTHEFALEGAALCNPSAVAFGDTGGDELRFVMSVRAIGEGHRSSIGFRTGGVSASGAVSIDPPGRHPVLAETAPGLHARGVLQAKLAEVGDDLENAAFVLGGLPERFDDAVLEQRIGQLEGDAATRRRTPATIANLRAVARSAYRTEFPPDTLISERVLWPHSPAEANGMEDARFVRFTDDDGFVTYHGTYTAFDGANVAQHLLSTTDFRTFHVSPMAGAGATGKGLALFPRRIGGRYAALSRSDRETNAIAFSDDLRCWPTATTIQRPVRPWEIVQLGNCGSPIETEAGWLVLTHGVGPMRTYALGAMLLELEHPEIVIGRSPEPVITPEAPYRDGYVPNVVYTCGGFARGDVLVLPYGVGDQTIAIATLSIGELLSTLSTP